LPSAEGKNYGFVAGDGDGALAAAGEGDAAGEATGELIAGDATTEGLATGERTTDGPATGERTMEGLAIGEATAEGLAAGEAEDTISAGTALSRPRKKVPASAISPTMMARRIFVVVFNDASIFGWLVQPP